LRYRKYKNLFRSICWKSSGKSGQLIEALPNRLFFKNL